MNWINQLLEIARSSTKILSWICLMSFLLLVAPSRLLGIFRLDAFLNEYGTWVGLAFISSVSLLAINVGKWAAKRYQKRRGKQLFEEDVSRRIETLDPSETAVLREFFIQARNTVPMPVDHPTVAGLIQKGILHSVASNGRLSLAGAIFPMALTASASARITAGVVGLPMGHPSPAQMRQIADSRPPFVQTLEHDDWLARI